MLKNTNIITYNSTAMGAKPSATVRNGIFATKHYTRTSFMQENEKNMLI